jgi:hypothetical protein
MVSIFANFFSVSIIFVTRYLMMGDRLSEAFIFKHHTVCIRGFKHFFAR